MEATAAASSPPGAGAGPGDAAGPCDAELVVAPPCLPACGGGTGKSGRRRILRNPTTIGLLLTGQNRKLDGSAWEQSAFLISCYSGNTPQRWRTIDSKSMTRDTQIQEGSSASSFLYAACSFLETLLGKILWTLTFSSVDVEFFG